MYHVPIELGVSSTTTANGFIGSAMRDYSRQAIRPSGRPTCFGYRVLGKPTRTARFVARLPNLNR